MRRGDVRVRPLGQAVLQNPRRGMGSITSAVSAAQPLTRVTIAPSATPARRTGVDRIDEASALLASR